MTIRYFSAMIPVDSESMNRPENSLIFEKQIIDVSSAYIAKYNTNTNRIGIEWITGYNIKYHISVIITECLDTAVIKQPAFFIPQGVAKSAPSL